MILCFAQNAFGQYYSFNQHVRYADERYIEGQYLLALEHYYEASQLKGLLKKQSLFNYADAAFKVSDLALAEQLFMLYQENDKAGNGHEVLYNLIVIRQMQERYEEAILDCNIYISEYEELDINLTEKVNSLKESCQWALAEIREAMVDSVQNMKSVNSIFSEQSPFIYGDSLYYNAINQMIVIDKEKQYYSRIYKGGQKPLELIGVPENKLISHPSFSSDGKYFFYSVGDYAEDGTIIYDIYFSLVNQDTTIGVPRKLLAPINSDAYTSAHASAITVDTIIHLYFSSDRPGGKGGFDIWRAEMSLEMEVLNLVNLEDINTSSDEYSPFLNFNTNDLYFSSNGHLGYGGFDIFRIAMDEDSLKSVDNVGPKLNSSYNDLFFSTNVNGSVVYFTSNRPGSMLLDSRFESCCYDIYTAEVTECSIDLLALIYNRTGGEMLNDTKFVVIDPETQDTVYSNESDENLFEVELDCDKEYIIQSIKEGFDLYELSFRPTNFSYGQDNEIIRKIYLNPSIYDLNLTVLSKDTNLPLDSLNFVLTNINTGDQVEINKHPSNNIHFDVLPGTNYKIDVSRNGYKDTTEVFNSGNKSNIINKTIYLEEKEVIKQAKISLAETIPLALFFDNDAPVAGDSTHLSGENYSDTYEAYYDKRGKYVFNYVSKFSGRRQDDARREASQFFDGEVRVGFEKYDIFKKQLLLVLESGQEVNIYLRGYASPLALDEYNQALGRRRVDSVRKEFDDWNGGVLLPYINNGQLLVTERSFGEETSPKEVSDDPSKPYQSIYSPGASRERRVEIDEINFNKN